MADIFGTGNSKAMQGVIDAASKIMMGIKDSDTEAAQTEEDHPIVAAAEEKVEEAKTLDTPAVEKSLKHDCATHVVHKEHGEGRCIPGMHTLEETSEGEGIVTHYDVMFKEGLVQNCPVEELEIVHEMSHGHAKKKK